MINSNLEADIALLKEAINKLAPCLNENVNDDLVEFSVKKWNAVSASGFLGLIADKTYQGLDLDLITAMRLMEEFGYTCDDSGLIFSIITQIISAQVPVMEFGSNEQKEKYMPGLVDGSIISGHAITEPNSGSDAYAMKTTATQYEDGYVLNGSKTFITNGPIADLVVVYALTDPIKGIFGGVSAFLLEKNTPGFIAGNPIKKMGLNSSPFGELFFDNCKIKASQLLGKLGAGYRILEHVMAREILLISISQIGEMRRLIDKCVEYSKTRKQYGKPIANNQAISHKIADMKVSLEAAKTLLYSTANDLNNRDNFKVKLSASKIFTSESYVNCSLDAIQIFGAYGYTKEFGIEKYLRNSIASKIYSGSSEIHRNIIANILGL